MKTQESVCIEMIFRAASDAFVPRIGLARDAGYNWVEFWGWANKDIAAIKDALVDTKMRVTGFVMEPNVDLADRDDQMRFVEGLEASITVAQRLGAPFLYMQAGRPQPDMSREKHREIMAESLALGAGVLEDSGVTLLLEAVSDNASGYLELGGEALDIVAMVDRSEVRVLYDVYHSAVYGEDWVAAIGTRMDLIAHVHLADHPGRGGPGTGNLDIPAIKDWFIAQGYEGLFGLEYAE